MPIYQSAEMTREQLDKLRKRNVCAICGGWLNRFMGEDGQVFLACAEWPRSHHKGIMRLSELRELNAEARREQMTTELGAEKTRALEKYAAPGTVITESIATKIVETLWKEAPAVEKAKAIMLAHQYQLNPLKKHIYILGPFKKWNKDHTKVIREEWAVVEGIGATRLQAHRKHRFSYLDLSPRVATNDELEKILGDNIDRTKLYVITLLKDLDTGAEAYGLGSWPKSEKPYGEEKGNSPFNMAATRSERQGFNRLYPAEMPETGLDVVDERFLPDVLPSTPAQAQIRTVNEETGEISEGEVTETGAQEHPDERVEQGQAKSTRTETPRDVDLRMLRAAASKLKWDKLRLDKEVKERAGKPLDQLNETELHGLASKLTDLAECA